jgi:hypothetical protein
MLIGEIITSSISSDDLETVRPVLVPHYLKVVDARAELFRIFSVMF